MKYPIMEDLSTGQIEAINKFKKDDRIKYERIKCKICGSEKSKTLFKNDRYGFKQDTVICKNVV